jgi:hypothetical protein
MEMVLHNATKIGDKNAFFFNSFLKEILAENASRSQLACCVDEITIRSPSRA